MKTKIICIIDRSGSMASIANDAIGGFNTFLNDQKKVDGEAVMDLILFDTKFKKVVSNTDIQKVNELNRETYTTGGMTALYDAIGIVINEELDYLAKDPKNRCEKTLCVILTDGESNSDREYSKSKIKLMIEEMTNDFNWCFMYLGANQDSFTEAGNIGISKGNTVNFSATSDGIRVAYNNINVATKHYRTTSEDKYDNLMKNEK